MLVELNDLLVERRGSRQRCLIIAWSSQAKNATAHKIAVGDLVTLKFLVQALRESLKARSI